MNLYGPSKVGGDVLAHCGKCKRELAHVIVAMVGGKPARVICKTCKSEHNYRLGVTSAPAKSGLARTAKPKSTFVKHSEYWEQKMATKKQVPMRPYQVHALYQAGDVIQHSKFGAGIIEEVKPNGKIVVLFRDEERTLIHGLTPSTES